jgi:tRNA G18 (ribose-2'-O)-methylase SpoU
VANVENIYKAVHRIREPKKIPVDVLLDNLRSALNVGSIFRSADGTGIKKIYCCGITPTPENPKVKKTALGAEETIPWEMNRNGLATAVRLKSYGYSLWALEDTAGAESLFRIDPKHSNLPLVLIVGHEASGIDPGIINICDKVLTIPMVGIKQSYNVAIAFGIAASFLLYRFLDDDSS